MMPEPTTLGEWAHLLNLRTSQDTTDCWRQAPTYVSTLGLSRIDHVFYGGKGCECLYATHYGNETYGDYMDHRPLSLSIKLQHGREPAGLFSSKPIPLYKASLLPQSPEDELRFLAELETWILRHPTRPPHHPRDRADGYMPSLQQRRRLLRTLQTHTNGRCGKASAPQDYT